jgi:hypothetical protein
MLTLRLAFKLLLRRWFLLPSFCKRCGRRVPDVSAPDDAWAAVESRLRRGHVLCYDCFCEVCADIGLPSVWALRELAEP